MATWQICGDNVQLDGELAVGVKLADNKEAIVRRTGSWNSIGSWATCIAGNLKRTDSGKDNRTLEKEFYLGGELPAW